MTANEIVERIMSAHWDLAACPCWVCKAGREIGLSSKEGYLQHRENNRNCYPVPNGVGFTPVKETVES